MKSTIWLLLVLTTVLPATAQKATSLRLNKGHFLYRYSTGPYEVTGPVQSLVTTFYRIAGDTAEVDFSSKATFNRQGYVLSDTLFKRNGTPTNTKTYTYNSRGQLAEINETFPTDAGPAHIQTVFTYTGNKVLSRATDVKRNRELTTTTTVLDKHDRVQAGSFSNGSRTYNYTSTLIYDAQGRPFQTRIVQNGKTEILTSIYDKAGNEIGQHNSREKDTGYFNQRYDAFGFYYLPGQILRYDARNNWVSKSKVEKGKELPVQRRMIVYYP